VQSVSSHLFSLSHPSSLSRIEPRANTASSSNLTARLICSVAQGAQNCFVLSSGKGSVPLIPRDRFIIGHPPLSNVHSSFSAIHIPAGTFGTEPVPFFFGSTPTTSHLPRFLPLPPLPLPSHASLRYHYPRHRHVHTLLPHILEQFSGARRRPFHAFRLELRTQPILDNLPPHPHRLPMSLLLHLVHEPILDQEQVGLVLDHGLLLRNALYHRRDI